MIHSCQLGLSWFEPIVVGITVRLYVQDPRWHEHLVADRSSNGDWKSNGQRPIQIRLTTNLTAEKGVGMQASRAAEKDKICPRRRIKTRLPAYDALIRLRQRLLRMFWYF